MQATWYADTALRVPEYLEIGKSALTVPGLLSVLFSIFFPIYRLNKLLTYCQGYENCFKDFWCQDHSCLLRRKMSGHKLQLWTTNLVCPLARAHTAWMKGHMPSFPTYASACSIVSSQWFPNTTFRLTPHYSALGYVYTHYNFFCCWLAKLPCTWRR